jgi:plastocyanin
MSAAQARARMVIATLCAGCLVACGSGGGSSSADATSSSSSSGSPSSAAGNSASTITIEGFRFTTPDSVSPGATITVDNKDGTAHTVTSDAGKAFDDPAAPGTSTFTAPTKPGSYPFHCTLHPGMRGTLVVA